MQWIILDSVIVNHRRIHPYDNDMLIETVLAYVLIGGIIFLAAVGIVGNLCGCILQILGSWGAFRKPINFSDDDFDDNKKL